MVAEAAAIGLPKPIPRLLGAIEFDGAGVTFHVDIRQTVKIDGAPVGSASRLRLNDEHGASLIRSGDLSMAPIRHAGRVGMLVWNRARTERDDFPGRCWFDVDERYRILAEYTAYPAPTKINMPDALGGFEVGYVQGYVSFRLDWKSHRLDAIETEDGRLLLQFRDRPNGAQTYLEGR